MTGRRGRLAASVVALAAVACSTTVDPSPTPSHTANTTTPAVVATREPATTPPAPSTAPAMPSTPLVTPTPTPTPEPVVVGPIDPQAAFDLASALADGVGTRIPGTGNDELARSVISRAFLAAGWRVRPDPFDLPQGGSTANLLATIDGTIPDGPLVIVGSHMDTLGGVGANDNASGVGVLVEVARELADEAAAFPIPVVLVAFAAEERQDAPGRPNHLGSERLAALLADRTVTMLSVDMVGNGPSTRVVGLERADRTLVDRIAAIAVRDGIADVVTDARGNVSDHGSFANLGVPAAFLWTGPDEHLHSAADTTEHLDLDDLARAGALTLAFLRDLGPEDVAGLRPTPATAG